MGCEADGLAREPRPGPLYDVLPAPHARPLRACIAGCAFAATAGAAAVGIAALPAARWHTTRARLNARTSLAGQLN